MKVTAGLLLLQLLVFAGLSAQPAQALSCLQAGTDWQLYYESQLGLCYYFRAVGSRQQVNHTVASQWCSSAANVPNVPQIRLSRLSNQQQWTLIVRALTEVGIGYSNLWTEATCNSTTGRYMWGSGEELSELKSMTCNASKVVQFAGLVSPASDGSYKVTSVFSAVPLNTVGTTVCEYDVPRCNMSSLSNYNSTRMRPDVDPAADNRTVKAACAPGYYRPAEVDGIPDSLVRNRYRCEHDTSSGGPIGSARLVTINNSVVDSCSIMSCKGSVLLNLSLNVDFKDSYKNLIDPNREYLFGESIPVECKTGYVKITNTTDVNSTIDCHQNALKPSEGQWDPIFCTPVACNKSAMSGAYDYRTMTMYKAYDRLKDRTYTSAETHLFPYYPNVVYVRCLTPGQFFKDRKYDKTFQCNLLPNSTIEAGWNPVEGTLESSMQCQPITCLTNELVAISYRATMQDYLSKGNFNTSVTLTDDTGLETNRTLKDFLDVSEYKYTVAVRFDCKYGFAMTAVNDTDGKTMSVTSMQSTCSSVGSWNKIISECIKMSAAIDATSGKRYVPEPKEAGSAQSLGATVIVILVVFFTLIVVLDIATLSRDIKLLKQNIRRLKLKASMKKNS